MSDALRLVTAGALSVLLDPEIKARLVIDVARVVCASSSALNGLYCAAAVRAGTEAFARQRLVRSWLEDATIGRAFAFSLPDVVRGLGLSSRQKLLELMRKEIRP